MYAYTRHKIIVEMLQRSGRLSVHAVASQLGVSDMTVRRDFRELEAAKVLLRVKGGDAVPHPACYEPESLVSEVNDTKFELAKALHRRLLQSETIFIGSGSTCLCFAKIVARLNLLPLTVVTHSLPVALALFQSRCMVMLLGGELRTNSMDLVGPSAEKNLEDYHVNWLVSGCDGAFADYGFYTSDVRLSNLEQRMISVADHIAIITESAKFGRRALTRFASLDDVDLLVTDDNLDPGDEEKLVNHDIEVMKVPAVSSNK